VTDAQVLCPELVPLSQVASQSAPENAPTNVPFGATIASQMLDAIRGIAAFIVIIEHWRSLFFVDFAQISRHRVLLIPLYLFTGGGHQAVLVFFVLSGFLISSSIFSARLRGSWNWKAYVVHRLTRLMVGLIPALLLGALWDSIGLHLQWSQLFYHGATQTDHVINDVRGTLTLETFFGNLAFLQTIRVPVFGTNGALWSLANEFWYYMLFPLALFALKGPGRAWIRIVQGLGFVALGLFVGKDIMLSFPLWLAGVLLYKSWRFKKPKLGWLVFLLPGYIMVFFGRFHYNHLLQEVVLTSYTFLILWLVLSFRGRATHRAFSYFSREASGFSYTLYLVHTPMLALCASVLTRSSRWYPDARHFTVALLVLLVTLAYAYLVASFTELKTGSIRRWVEFRLGIATPPKPVEAF
jgi:peptidoglycan/LPS O-acetylase OafA/YrhL